MVQVSNNQVQISIIIPTLNEANKLPLLIADLGIWSNCSEIQVVDGGSEDLTILAAKIAGANVINLSKANRGEQLQEGANASKGEWLLFLHADSRLDKRWKNAIRKIIIRRSYSKDFAWYFDFRINNGNICTYLLQIAVALRCSLLKRPYGDQGLFIHKSLYKKIGGFKSFHIMEDLDFVERLTKRTSLKRIGIPIYTDGRKWKQVSILRQAIRNARLRRRWKSGVSTKELFDMYYSKTSRK